jgi:hypothetical protein
MLLPYGQIASLLNCRAPQVLRAALFDQEALELLAGLHRLLEPPRLCNNTGFVMQAETEVTGETAGKPDIFVPKPCPNGCLPPQK